MRVAGDQLASVVFGHRLDVEHAGLGSQHRVKDHLEQHITELFFDLQVGGTSASPAGAAAGSRPMASISS